MADGTAAARAGDGAGATDASELDALKQQIKTKDAEIASLRSRAGSAETAVATERTNRFAAQEQAVASGIEAAKAKNAEAKRKRADLLAQADDEKDLAKRRKLREQAEDLVDEIADARAELRGWENHGEQIKAAKARAEHQPTEADKFERGLAQLPKPAQDWCRAHPEYVTDPRKNARAQAAHHLAVADGIQEWTPAYWEHVETTLGIRKPAGDRTAGGKREERAGAEREETDHGVDLSGWDDPEGEGEGEGGDAASRAASFTDRTGRGEPTTAAEQLADENARSTRRASPTREETRRQERAASTAAPPSRGSPSGTGGERANGRTRQPTAGELEAAKISFPDEWKKSPKEALSLYFQNQAALRREGRIQ